MTNSNECIGVGVPFNRIRRITGYLSNVTRWNDAKQHEEQERTKHNAKSMCKHPRIACSHD